MAQPLATFQGNTLYVDAMILAAFLDIASPWSVQALTEALAMGLQRAVEDALPQERTSAGE